ncbi:MAG: hypothetical protein WDZ49_17120 [Litorilinea sp.]
MTKQTNGQAGANSDVPRKMGTPKPVRKSAGRVEENSVLLSTTPGWLNWAAVTLAVLIVAGIFMLSALQLRAPEDGVNASQLLGIQAGVGGMQLDTDATPSTVPATVSATGQAAADGTDTEAETPATPPDIAVEPGGILINAADRVELYADADGDSSFLDSYARGGTFVVMEPTGDHMAYPVVVDDDQWIRVRAADGLVGWTSAHGLQPAP